MKREFLAASAAAALLAGAGMAGQAAAQTAYDTAVENTAGLLGYYPFTQASQANDVANGHTGTLQGSASIGGAGTGFGTDPNQSSLVLPNTPNTGSYATAGGANPLQGGVSSTGTVAAWINLASLPSTAGRIFSIAGESQGGDDLDLQIDNSDNQLRFYTNGGGYVGAATDFDSSSLNQWIFVVGTFSDTGTTDLYVDGVLAGTGGPGGHGAENEPFYVGQSNAFGNREFDGSLGGVALFDTQLTGDQVEGLYKAAEGTNTGGGVPEPAAWALMLVGFGGLGAQLRWARQHRTVAIA
ncbi:LamG-like jellyroll fold domain-containing protein [Phenylobacterium sp.]|uniref:LamG-like jellyroll fold domain-containing protein n=1 Tax=Phenylobacterium sp. TaxID=1871053 RepID=UPI0025E2CF44|nr:LamG-like jellyroll fold domain-containing protein [Phenylobacterium sp.]